MENNQTNISAAVERGVSRRRRRPLSVAQKKSLYAYVYLIPGTVLMLLFVVVPVAMSVVMSFYNIPSLGADWVFDGFANYGRVFATRGFLKAMGRTVLFGGWGIVVGLFFGIILAFFVAKHRFLNAYRYIFYLPSVVSAITMGRLWNYMLTPSETGFFNVIVMSLGAAEPVNWLGNESLVPYIVMGLGLFGAGGGMSLVLFTTAINNVSASLTEAAKIEGASSLQIALRIELPMIRPIIASFVVLSVIGAFKNFEGLYALVPNSPGVETIAVLLYKESIASSYGYGLASAMGVVLTLIVMIIMVVYVKWPSKGGIDA